MRKKSVFVSMAVLVALAIVNAQIAPTPTQIELPFLPTPDFSKLTAYPVVRIVDGDTIVVSDKGKDVKVRLAGVDTPETVHPTKPVEHC
jgi:micrococcal nuclease